MQYSSVHFWEKCDIYVYFFNSYSSFAKGLNETLWEVSLKGIKECQYETFYFTSETNVSRKNEKNKNFLFIKKVFFYSNFDCMKATILELQFIA